MDVLSNPLGDAKLKKSPPSGGFFFNLPSEPIRTPQKGFDKIGRTANFEVRAANSPKGRGTWMSRVIPLGPKYKKSPPHFSPLPPAGEGWGEGNQTMKLLLAIILTITSTTCFPANTQDFQQESQNIINNYLIKQGKKEYLPGLVVSIAIPKQKRTYNFSTGNRGFAPLVQTMQIHDYFQIGSITKSFTSAIILQLAGENKLNLDDELGQWLPQYPQWQKVTIRELLNMTSGIPNYTEDKAFAKKAFPHNRQEFSFDELLSYAHPEKKIARPPRKYEYSNTNYILAGKIIEAITNDTYKNQLYQRIIIPFHLSHTYYFSGANWQAQLKQIYPQMAHGYTKDDNDQTIIDITADNLSWAGPAGGIIATTQDTLKWVDLLYSGKVFSPKNKQKLLEELKLLVAINSGKKIPKTNQQNTKGFGLGVANIYSDKLHTNFWFYEGSTLGYRVAYIYHPEDDVIIVASLNSKGGEGKASDDDKIGLLLTELYQNVLKYYP